MINTIHRCVRRNVCLRYNRYISRVVIRHHSTAKLNNVRRLFTHNYRRKFLYFTTLSLTAYGTSVLIKTDSNSDANPLLTDIDIDIDTDTDPKKGGGENLEKSHRQLMLSLPVPEHNKIVWVWLYIKRAIFLLFNFAPIVLLALPAYLDETNKYGIKQFWLTSLHQRFASGGSTFIKLGQWISMRSDIFPLEICESLANLRISAPFHTFEETCRVIETSFGKPIDDIFERFYIDPVASGSIAQIHKAQIRLPPPLSKQSLDSVSVIHAVPFNAESEPVSTCVAGAEIQLRSETLEEKIADARIREQCEIEVTDGVIDRLKKTWKRLKYKRERNEHIEPTFIDVAVKVRHPSILETMAIDIDLLYIGSNFISSLPGLSGLKVPIYQPKFAEYLESQIDLSFEAHSLEKFNHFFSGERDNVIFPKPVMPYVAADVMVETWEPGIPLSQLDFSKMSLTHLHQLSKQCFDIFMKMILRDNFVHGDCHSGNILVRCKSDYSKLKTKTATDKHPFGALVFLDAGLTASLTQEGIERFGVLMGHIASANAENAAKLFAEWALLDLNNDPTAQQRKENFAHHLTNVISTSLRWRDPQRPNKGIPFLEVGSLIRNVLVLTQQEQIVLDSEFSAVIASLGIIEGLIRELDEKADFLSWGVPYLMKFRGISALSSLLSDHTDLLTSIKPLTR